MNILRIYKKKIGETDHMSVKIYYFTGTGNSLAVAQDIANKLDDTDLISIPGILGEINENIKTDTPIVGLVFPVYIWGMPKMVVNFAENLELKDEQYVFAVTTCAGQPGETLLQLQEILKKKGRKLDAGFAVKSMPNTIQKDNILIKIAMLIERKLKISKTIAERLPEIVDTIKRNQHHPPETSSSGLNLFGKLMYKMSIGHINTLAKFSVDEKCNLCLNCLKICPSNNIEIIDDKPTWDDKCEFCQACIQWCPKEAIHIKNEDFNRRYHNPQIKIKDLMLR